MLFSAVQTRNITHTIYGVQNGRRLGAAFTKVVHVRFGHRRFIMFNSFTYDVISGPRYVFNCCLA